MAELGDDFVFVILSATVEGFDGVDDIVVVHLPESFTV
jgi:hypothetical protein